FDPVPRHPLEVVLVAGDRPDDIAVGFHQRGAGWEGDAAEEGAVGGEDLPHRWRAEGIGRGTILARRIELRVGNALRWRRDACPDATVARREELRQWCLGRWNRRPLP